MIYCKRCSLAYIRGESPIEEVGEAKIWFPVENNEMWMVCEKCARVLRFCHLGMTVLDLDPKKRLEFDKRRYEETKELN